MNCSVILAHPDKGSFNHAIAEVVRNTLVLAGYQVFFHDLYKEQFNPLFMGNRESKKDDQIETYSQE